MKTSIIILVSSALLIIGCAKDRTTQEYNSQQAAIQAQQVSRDTGTYSGLVQLQNGRTAAMQFKTMIDLSSTSTENNTDQKNVGLRGTINVTTSDGTVFQNGFTQATYADIDRGYFITIPVTLQDGSTSSVTIAGNFSDGSVSGSIYTPNYNTEGGTFSLAKNGTLPSISSLVGPRASATAAITNSEFYTGLATGPGSGVFKDQNILLKVVHVPTIQQEFFEFFTPIQLVEVQLGFQDATFNGANYSTVRLSNCQIDSIQGKLQYCKAGTEDFSCKPATNANGSATWACTLTGVTTNTFILTPSNAPTN